MYGRDGSPNRPRLVQRTSPTISNMAYVRQNGQVTGKSSKRLVCSPSTQTNQRVRSLDLVYDRQL